MAKYWEDWSGSTIGAQPTGWSKRGATTGDIFTVQAESDPLAPAGRRCRMLQPSTAQNTFLTLDAADGDAARTNFTIAALCRSPEFSAVSGGRGGVAGRVANAASATAYVSGFRCATASSAARSNDLFSYVAGTFGEMSRSGDGTVAATTLYWVELQVADAGDGSANVTRRLRSASEPSTILYQATVSSSVITADGGIGLFQRFSNEQIDVLAVAIATGTDEIFFSAPGGDTTAPALTSPSASATGATTASGSVTTDEANGTLYYLATANASESAATVKAGSSQAVSAAGSQSVSLTGLTASASYYMHFVHRDAAGNDSAVASSPQFTTEAEAVPVKGVTIPLYNGSTPQASITGIRALWWDATAPDATPDYYTASASTDASGALTLDLDAATGLDVGDYGYLLLHKDGTPGAQHRDALEFAGAVQITDIS